MNLPNPDCRPAPNVRPAWWLWPLALALLIVPLLGRPVQAQAPFASPAASPGATPLVGADLLPEGPLGQQIAWVISAANGNVDVSNPAAIAAHFTPAYLEDRGIQGLMVFAYGLIRTYSPVTLVAVTPNADGTAAVAMLRAADGSMVRFTLEIDPDTGQISDLAIVPADATPTASPAA